MHVDPVILNCGHNVCHPCSQNVDDFWRLEALRHPKKESTSTFTSQDLPGRPKNEPSTLCHLCQNGSRIDRGRGVDILPLIVVMKKFLDELLSRVTLCDVCEEACLECQASYCLQYFEKCHSGKRFVNHAGVPAGETQRCSDEVTRAEAGKKVEEKKRLEERWSKVQEEKLSKEAKRMEEEARRLEKEAKRLDEAIKLEEEKRKLEEEKRLEETRRLKEEARKLEEAQKLQEEKMAKEAQRMEEEGKRLEKESSRLDKETKLQEEKIAKEVQMMEEEAKRLAKEARRLEEEVKRFEEARKLGEDMIVKEKRMLEEEASRLEMEAKGLEEARKFGEEKRLEEARRLEEEGKEARRLEEARMVEEEKRLKEARRLEEARRSEEEKRLEETRRLEEEVIRLEEARKLEEKKRLEETRLLKEEAGRLEVVVRKLQEEQRVEEQRKVVPSGSLIDKNTAQRLLAKINNPGKRLQLLYRASADGWSNKTFHERCDNKGPTFTVAKFKTDVIFGAYTSLSWHSSGNWSADASAFLFRVNSSANVSFGEVIPNGGWVSDAVCRDANYGPIFGGCNDLYLQLNDVKQSHANGQYTYSHANFPQCSLVGSRDGWFPTEVEVFGLADLPTSSS